MYLIPPRLMFLDIHSREDWPNVSNAFHLWTIMDNCAHEMVFMCSNKCFSKAIFDVFPPWHCVNTHLNLPDKQTARTAAFIEVCTSADCQFMKSRSSKRAFVLPRWFLMGFKEWILTFVEHEPHISHNGLLHLKKVCEMNVINALCNAAWGCNQQSP